MFASKVAKLREKMCKVAQRNPSKDETGMKTTDQSNLALGHKRKSRKMEWKSGGRKSHGERGQKPIQSETECWPDKLT